MSGARRWLLLAVCVAAFAIFAPGLALADGTAVADEVVVTAPAAPTDGTVVTDPTTAPDPTGGAPVQETPVVEPPTTEAPAPPPATGETPVPPETESTPTPAPAPTIIDTAPPPSSSALPTAPDAPKAIIEPDKLPVALMPQDHPVQVAIPPAADTSLVGIDVKASVPDAPAPVTPAAAPRQPALPVATVPTQNAALHQDLFTLDPGQRHSPVGPVAATRMERGPGIGLGDEVVSTLFGESVVAPIGTITSGSSLLAVLAGYVLPGVGGPPATTLIMFVLVGLLVAIARAPRPQLSERLWSGSLMGAASGHGLAVCRPG